MNQPMTLLRPLPTRTVDLPSSEYRGVPSNDYRGVPSFVDKKTQDEIFGELITRMVGDLPECQEKALLKIDIQHRIIKTQYQLMPHMHSFHSLSNR